jgi:hypothetical protein
VVATRYRKVGRLSFQEFYRKFRVPWHKKPLAQILSGYVERLDVTRELGDIQALPEAQRNL